MKFLSERFIEKRDIDFLKKSRRRYVRNKIINHNGNFIEHLNTERMLAVVPEGDEILDLINKHLVPALEDTWFDEKYLPEKWLPKNYDYRKLPLKLRKYMYVMDELLYNLNYKGVSEGVPLESYDRRMERLLKVIPDYTDDDLRDYVLLGKPIPSTVGRKAKESARRAYKTVNGIVKANINKFTNFVTLTFAPEKNEERHKELNNNRLENEYNLELVYVQGDDFEVAKKKFSVTINNFAKKLRSRGIEFEYLAVWEIQRNGFYHFHLLTTRIPNDEHYKVPSWLDYDHRDDKFEKGYGLLFWKYGKSDVQEIRSHAQISTYISKYIFKSFRNVTEESYDQYLGKRKYFPSKGLVRPIIDYVDDDDIDEVLKAFDLEDVQPYERNYINPYNDGRITNKIYTMIDMQKNTAASLGREHDSGETVNTIPIV